MNNRKLDDAYFGAPAGVVFRAGSRKSGGVGGAICPRCPEFISVNSRVVRLHRPEEPDSIDGRHDVQTGRAYYADGREIIMKPRWWVHERCYNSSDKPRFVQPEDIESEIFIDNDDTEEELLDNNTGRD